MRKIYQGIIREGDYGENYAAILLDGLDSPLAEATSPGRRRSLLRGCYSGSREPLTPSTRMSTRNTPATCGPTKS
jgi:hypothetical protein